MHITFEQYNPGLATHAAAVPPICEWSEQAGTMVVITPESMADYPVSLIGFAEDTQEPVGHIALTSHHHGNAIVGAHVTNPDYRGQGIGALALGQLLTETAALPDLQTIMAYVNNRSMRLYLAAGAELAGIRPQVAPTGCNYVVDLMLARMAVLAQQAEAIAPGL